MRVETRFIVRIAALLSALLILTAPSGAAAVSDTDGQGWWTHAADGEVAYFTTDMANTGAGSLAIQTPNGGKAGATNAAYSGMQLSDIYELSFSTYHESGGTSGTFGPAVKFQVQFAGDQTAFLIFEPFYVNNSLTIGQWQTWDAMTMGGWWWTAGPGAGTYSNTWNDVQNAFSDAEIIGAGMYLEAGSGTYGVDAYVDSVWVNGTFYDLEPQPSTIADCQEGGWESYGRFKNQGDCIQFVNTGR